MKKGLAIALILLILFILWTYFFYIPNQENRIFKNTYPLIDPGRSLIENKNLIINFQPLRVKLRSYEDNPKFTIGIYFEYLPTGANISVNKDVALWPASLLKIPVAMVVMKKIESGEWKLSNELILLPDDKNAEFGMLYQKQTGTRFTIETLLKESLVNSDNTAHFILLRNTSEDELLDIYEHLGIEDLRKNQNSQITAKRYSVFFRALYNASYLSPEYSQKLLRILDNDMFKDYLASGLPSDIQFSHKVGIQIEKKSFADSGIVYALDRPYILTVMVQIKDEKTSQDEVKQLMKEISQEIYNYVINASI